jgi:hypothetical protein
MQILNFPFDLLKYVNLIEPLIKEHGRRFISQQICFLNTYHCDDKKANFQIPINKKQTHPFPKPF